jgi:hypothetical protein
MNEIFASWGRILAGFQPALSIELTRECPLRCPGCYAYGDEHLGGGVTLRQLHDLKGQALVDGVLDLVRERRPIPEAWAALRRLQLVVSIDGLQPEHDERRKPATYERILKHIAGHQMIVHWTITRQQLRRDGYLEAFVKFWSDSPNVRQIWVSLYTPQVGEVSDERLTPEDRSFVVAELMRLREIYPRLYTPRGLLQAFAAPPSSPDDCIFAQTTGCVSADFTTPITPCQFGGQPDCSECGCMASAGLAAVGRHRLPIGVRVQTLFDASLKVGAMVRKLRAPAPPREGARLPEPSTEETAS